MKYYISELNSAGNIAVDDTILVKGTPATAGSHLLDGFVPLFSAEAVERLENAGYIVSGKTNVGEFGLDLLGEGSYYEPVVEDGHLVGAAAALVAQGKVKAALNVDLNGAPRRAAAVSGIDFIKPTYGTVSRYGVIPCACSGEQIGVSAANAADVKELLSIIAGHDAKDGTSLPARSYNYALDVPVSELRVCVVRELLERASVDSAKKVAEYADKLCELGAKVESISFEPVFAAQTAWQILMAAETCNNLSRYDGVKFGYRTPNYKNIDDLYVNTRTEGTNFLTKATIVYGSDVLSKGRYEQCYDKALRIRRVVYEQMQELLSCYDVVLMPACSTLSYQPYDLLNAFETVFDESVYTAIPNITGVPAMVTKGVQLISGAYKESILLSVAASVESMEA